MNKIFENSKSVLNVIVLVFTIINLVLIVLRDYLHGFPKPVEFYSVVLIDYALPIMSAIGLIFYLRENFNSKASKRNFSQVLKYLAASVALGLFESFGRYLIFDNQNYSHLLTIYFRPIALSEYGDNMQLVAIIEEFIRYMVMFINNFNAYGQQISTLLFASSHHQYLDISQTPTTLQMLSIYVHLIIFAFLANKIMLRWGMIYAILMHLASTSFAIHLNMPQSDYRVMAAVFCMIATILFAVFIHRSRSLDMPTGECNKQ